MDIKVDPAFRGTGRSWQRRRRLRRIRQAASGLAILTLVSAVAYYFMGSAEAEDGFVQVEASAETTIKLTSAGAETFLDIRGEPMIIVLPDDALVGKQRKILHDSIHPLRAPRGAEVNLIDSRLLEDIAQVRITIPSSSADLAAFQTIRSTLRFDAGLSGTSAAYQDDLGEVSAGETITVDDGEASWGDIVGGHPHGETEELTYVDTVVENTTTVLPSISGDRRVPLFRDIVHRVDKDQTLAEILLKENIVQEEIDRAMSQLSRLVTSTTVSLADVTNIKKGGLVALRVNRARQKANILQLSVYSPDRYLLSLAQQDPGRFHLSADPWFTKKLLAQADRVNRVRSTQGEIQMKDAIYGAALRNGMPSDLVGELMIMLSKKRDIDGIAGPKDRIKLLYSASGRGALSGRILFVGVTAESGNIECYVVASESTDAAYECFDPQSYSSGAGTNASGRLAAGLVTPVAGTKTSGFGPRNHPVLKRVVNHNGVDWGAPTGTPIHAAAPGRVTRSDFSKSYGNIVYIQHADGMETRYAHMHKFAPGIKVGVNVKVGELIGYVGTTGRSTGPHLHFEVRINGKPVNPLSLSGAQRGSAAVEALVNQIIRVESAGNARAKNSRSSATGLGQFISSTWVRMMKTYRPDLVDSLSPQDLLDLRFDPGLSREMVKNLARENESYLRSKGHAISAGRLYLAHFLGPAGANVALRANPETSVLDAMGAAVVKANPFLKGKTVGWMTDWSDRKMSKVSGGAVVTAPVRKVTPPDVKRYIQAVNAALE